MIKSNFASIFNAGIFDFLVTDIFLKKYSSDYNYGRNYN